MDVFKQLTRGVSFDKKKFRDDAQKFGIVKNEEQFDDSSTKDDENLHDVSLESIPKPDLNEPSTSESDQAESEEELTLLGNISVKKAKQKKKKKKSKELRIKLHQENVSHFRNVHRIHVFGSDIPEPIEKWDKLKDNYGFPDPLITVIKQNYPSPSPIQMQAIPMMLERREILACAPTGSGKTAAYLIPLIHLLQEPRKTGIRAVIVAPTRELSKQIYRECIKFSETRGLRTFVIDKVNKALKKFGPQSKFDILVTTPNRLVYMLEQDPPSVSLKSVEWLIVDESDKLFEAGERGFREQLAVVYKACDHASVRRGMFSATLAPDVEQWCKLNLDNLCTVTVGARNSATELVDQKLVYTGTEKGKLMAFQQMIRDGLKPPVLVFVQSKDRAQELHKELLKEKLKVDVIHSERSQLQRDNAVKAFRSGRTWVLICTELMGRGIDFKGVNLVVNYDFPPSTTSYIHRIGRTGRAGRRGQAVTMFTDKDRVLLRSIAHLVKASGNEVPEYMLHLKKASRQEKRKLARKAVKREGIIKESKYDKEKRLKLEAMIAGSKRRKRKMEEKGKENGDPKRPKVEETVEKKNKSEGKKKKKQKDVNKQTKALGSKIKSKKSPKKSKA